MIVGWGLWNGGIVKRMRYGMGWMDHGMGIGTVVGRGGVQEDIRNWGTHIISYRIISYGAQGQTWEQKPGNKDLGTKTLGTKTLGTQTCTTTGCLRDSIIALSSDVTTYSPLHPLPTRTGFAARSRIRHTTPSSPPPTLTQSRPNNTHRRHQWHL